jgi:hypothetical protein
MRAKPITQNPPTRPTAAAQAVGPTEQADAQAPDGLATQAPARGQRGDALRAALAGLNVSPADVDAAVAWARGR